jgi:hypothetical protein
MSGGIDIGQDDEFEDDEFEDDEPSIECDYGWECNCVKNGVDGEWDWKDGAWVCSGCGEIQ